MAFNKDKNKSSSNGNGSDAQDWKADGFINFYLPREDGGKRKLGTIMLYERNEPQAALIERLKKDPEAIKALADALIVEFNTAEIKEGTGFAF